jgi:hypothetical protein
MPPCPLPSADRRLTPFSPRAYDRRRQAESPSTSDSSASESPSVPPRAPVVARLTPLRSLHRSPLSGATRSSMTTSLPVKYLTHAPLEAHRSAAPRLPRELVRTDAILVSRSHRCRSPLPLRRSSVLPSRRHNDAIVCATQEHHAWGAAQLWAACNVGPRGHGMRPVLCERATKVLCHWATSRIRPIGLCFIFLFSEYIQIITSSKFVQV